MNAPMTCCGTLCYRRQRCWSCGFPARRHHEGDQRRWGGSTLLHQTWSRHASLASPRYALLIPVVAFSQENPLLVRQPALSATDICFTFAADIWIVPRAGGAARRLTASSARIPAVDSPMVGGSPTAR
jgi:hypothetical protein